MLSPEAFLTKVKPACEKFIHSANSENLKDFNKELFTIDDTSLNRFHSYILIPLLLKMDNIDCLNSELKIDLVLTLNRIIKRIKVRDKSATKTLLVVCLKQIYDFEKRVINDKASEEMKMAIVQCMAAAFQSSTSDTLEEFYSKDNTNLIATISMMCVDLINNEKYRKLRLAAVECLMSVFYVHDSSDFSDIVLRNNVACIVFVFLPKTVETLVSVANGDEKQGQKLIATSIKCLGRILWLIFEDYQRGQSTAEIETSDFIELVKNLTVANKTDDEILCMNSKSLNKEERLKSLLKLERDEEWLGASSRKLTPILKTMIKLRANFSIEIREQYAKMCCTLIENCHKYLHDSIPVIIENIFALSQDENENIKNLCVNLLHKMNNESTFSSIFSECVTSLFETHLISLPRIIHRWEDTEQLAEFLFLKGILENSGERCLSTVLCIPSNLEKFCNCLIVALELELNNELLKEEYALRDVVESESKLRPFIWRKFKNIKNDNIINLIQSISEDLGKSKVVDLIFDYLIEILQRDSPECNEVILILVMVLCGKDCSSHNGNNNENILITLEEVLQDRRWRLDLKANPMDRLPMDGNSRWYEDKTPGLYESAIEIRTRDIILEEEESNIDSERVSVNLRDAEINVLHTCLLLDAIGNFALVLQDRFQPYMYKVLNRVLEKASSTNHFLHEAAMFALISLQKASHLNSIPELISEYSNYISYHVNIALKKSSQDNSAIDIVSTVMQHASLYSISYLENIICTILEESSKQEQIMNIESYLKVFHMFLMNVYRWFQEFGEDNQNNFAKDQANKELLCQSQMYDKWMDLLNKSEIVSVTPITDETCVNDSDHQDDATKNTAQDEEMQSTERKLPQHIEIVVKILKEVLKFISSKTQMHKIISIECFITGLPILKDYENELLPIVHLVWYPFAQRFKDKDVIVLNRCFTLLEVLAKHAKDFLLQRSLKDIFPFLCQFLHESSKNTLGKTNLIPTQEFKLQSKLIKEYATLIESMEVHEREFDRISEAVLLYLSKKQPKILQELAIEYFCQMSCYNSPAVYIKASSHLPNADIKENIEKIIDYINSR